MTLTALMVLAIATAQAKDVQHYISVCTDGSVLAVCTRPFCDEGSAYYRAQDACADHNGLYDMVTAQGPRREQAALLANVEQAIAREQKKARDKAAEDRRLHEEARKEEEKRQKESEDRARKAEQARKAEEVRAAEARRVEEETRKAEDAARQAEEADRAREDEARRQAALPYDCLAGVCLNTPATRVVDKLVTVSEVVMHRKVEVCSGRVVQIRVLAGWVLPGYGGFEDILSSAQHATDTDGTPVRWHVRQTHTEMETMGWKVKTAGDGAVLHIEYESATKKGARAIMWWREEHGGTWGMCIEAVHPDKDALCAPKRRQGL